MDVRLFDVTELSRPEHQWRKNAGLRLIVSYRGAAAPAARGMVRDAAGTGIGRSFERLNAQAIAAPEQDAGKVWEALTDQGRGEAAGRLVTAAGIDKVWLDGVRKASLDASVAQIGAPKAWAAGYDGKGVKVAVLDTGVDQSHPDLVGQESEEKNFSGAADTADRFGHGTHVASTIAGTGAKAGGKYKGVAPGATILDGKVLDDEGSGSESGILAGMEWAAAQGADVINMSLGGFDAPGLDPLEEAVNRLTADTGVLFVVAAGNNGPHAGTVASPGSADAALTVGAVDKQDALADFSSRGPRAGDGGIKPDVTAPGVGITAASASGSLIAREVGENPAGYLTISGTSMATPHVAGAAALLKQQHPHWTGSQLKGVLTASSAGGAYGPFEQGSGRVDVASALQQTVLAEPVSVNFGTQLWPHTDDKPVTKTITYRNLGNQPVTLDLTVTATGPDGKPAPADFFTLAAQQVTVPAEGTATVDVTTDTRLGDRDGSYSAAVVATGGGQSVRSAATVEREMESYDLTVKHIGRDGQPAQHYTTTILGVTESTLGDVHVATSDPNGTHTARVRKGGYFLDAGVSVDPSDFTKGFDRITQPRLDITKDTTVTIDARTAKPVLVTPPVNGATGQLGYAAISVKNADIEAGVDWAGNDFTGYRTAHLGPALPAGSTAFQQFSGVWEKGTSEYHLAYGTKGPKVATGFVRQPKAGDLARHTIQLGSPLTGRTGLLTTFPTIDGRPAGFVVANAYQLPTTRTLYTNTSDVTWRFDLDQFHDDGVVPEAHYSAEDRTYRASKNYTHRFNKGVFGPKVSADSGIFRNGDEISGCLPMLADGDHHNGEAVIDSATSTLYRNGTKIGSNNDPLTCDSPFTVPAGKADYKLTTTLTRKGARVSTKVSAAWTFSSKQTTEPTALPVSAVRFTPPLRPDSTAKAGATMQVPVTVQGAAAGDNLKTLTVYVSYDGKTWKKTKVTNMSITVRNPKTGRGVSFRAILSDKQGSTLTQTIHNAYLGK
ncbi:S8 family peptidase [Streptomyces sp. NPDC002285]